jgi:hypothetical protein
LGNNYLRRSHLASAYQYFARALTTTDI